MTATLCAATFSDSYVCDINVVWCYVLSQYPQDTVLQDIEDAYTVPFCCYFFPAVDSTKRSFWVYTNCQTEIDRYGEKFIFNFSIRMKMSHLLSIYEFIICQRWLYDQQTFVINFYLANFFFRRFENWNSLFFHIYQWLSDSYKIKLKFQASSRLSQWE